MRRPGPNSDGRSGREYGRPAPPPRRNQLSRAQRKPTMPSAISEAGEPRRRSPSPPVGERQPNRKRCASFGSPSGSWIRSAPIVTPASVRPARRSRQAEVVHVVGVEGGFVVVQVGDFERRDRHGPAAGQPVERAVGVEDRGADFFAGRVGGEPVRPHHPHEGAPDGAAVRVVAVDPGHDRPGIDDVGAARQRVHLRSRQMADRLPFAGARSLAFEGADHANGDRRRPAHRAAEVADQVHRLRLVALVGREADRAGRDHDAAVTADDAEVPDGDPLPADEPVEGDRDVVESLRPVRTADLAFGAPRGAEDLRRRATRGDRPSPSRRSPPRRPAWPRAAWRPRAPRRRATPASASS